MKNPLKIIAFVISGMMFGSFPVQNASAEPSAYQHHKHHLLPVDQVKSDFAVMVLGSGGPVATSSGRAGSSLLIFVEKKPVLLMDTGSGSYKSLALSGAQLTDVHHFLYSHLHIDHTSDMSAMVKTLFFHRLAAGELLPAAINFYGPDSNVPAYDSMSDYVAGHYDAAHGVERYLHGNAAPYSWSVSNTALASIDPVSGLVSALSAGQLSVTATDANGVSGSAQLRITTVLVSLDTATLLVADTLQFNAQGGTAPYGWTVSDSSIASIDANGLLTGVGAGVTNVTVTDAAGVSISSADVTVREVVVAPQESFSAALFCALKRWRAVDADGLLSQGMRQFKRTGM